MLTVSDADGNVVRRIEGPVNAGFHRVAWDLRYPHSCPWTPAVITGLHRLPRPAGGAGQLSVSLAKRVNGQPIDLDQDQAFKVMSIVTTGPAGRRTGRNGRFQPRLDDLRRQVQGASAAVDAADGNRRDQVNPVALRGAGIAAGRGKAARTGTQGIQENINGNAGATCMATKARSPSTAGWSRP